MNLQPPFYLILGHKSDQTASPALLDVTQDFGKHLAAFRGFVHHPDYAVVERSVVADSFRQATSPAPTPAQAAASRVAELEDELAAAKAKAQLEQAAPAPAAPVNLSKA